MISRLVYSLTILFFLLSLLTTLCFDHVSCNDNFVKNEVDFERLVKSSNPSPNNLVNIVNIKTAKNAKFVSKTLIFPDFTSSNASVKTLTANVQTFSQHTGYIHIRHSYGARLFYFFFESRGSKNDPVVLWLTGGPGIASAKALFYDNGPYHINDDLSLKWNDFGWDKACHLLYVDQPIDNGFSYSSDHRDIRKNSKEVINDLYDFLQAFFQAHPEYVENDLFIAGASYSGHTIPLLASRIHKANKTGDDIYFNLKGLAIMNGFTNPEYTYSSFPDFIYANKLISRWSYDMLKKYNKQCLTLIQHCQIDDNVCKDAIGQCQDVFHRMRNIMGNPNAYDFRKHGEFYNYSRVVYFMDLDQVRKALGVGNRSYVPTSFEVKEAMANDSMKNYAGVIPSLLEDGIKVLIFDGEYDLVCNWLGNFRWVEGMKWSGRSHFLKINLTSYKVDGQEVGNVKNVGPLTYLKVLNAGHSVAMDQPYVSLQIFKNWMNS